MLRASAVVAVALASQLGVARAQNSEDVIAGSDVALTGGAVVANVHTGGALWFNPAGVARLDSRSVDLTAAVLSYSRSYKPNRHQSRHQSRLLKNLVVADFEGDLGRSAAD